MSELKNKSYLSLIYLCMLNNMGTSHWMLYITPMALFTGIYAAICNLWILAFAEWALVTSSVYYWSHYICRWRRCIDMVVVQLSLYTHLYFTLRYQSLFALKFYGLGITSYAIGVYYNSFIAHSFVWIFGCIANVFLINSLTSLHADNL